MSPSVSLFEIYLLSCKWVEEPEAPVSQFNASLRVRGAASDAMAFPVTPARKLLPSGFATARSVGVDLDDIGGFISVLWQLVKAKAAEFVAYLAALFAALAAKVDELLPPETRSETLRQWLHVAVTVVLPAVLGALVLHCCCGRARGSRGGRHMMVAPGRGGARMPRGVFEGNPRGYFLDLRARKPLVY